LDFEPSAESSSTTPSLTLPPPEGLPSKIFLHDGGLRAGWRLLIYAAFVVALGLGGSFVLRLFVRPSSGALSPSHLLIQEAFSFVVIFAAALIMAQIERRSTGVYGLPLRGAFGKLFWQGCLIGLIEVSALVGLIAAFGGYSFGGIALHGGELLRWGLLWAVFFLFVGLFEEFLFRGYIQFTLPDMGFWTAGILFSALFWRLHMSHQGDGVGFWLAVIWLVLIIGRVWSGNQGENVKGIGFWPAAILLSLLFGRVHLDNPGEGWVGAAGVVMIGLIFAFVLRRTGNLWLAVGWHASFDFGETFLYSVPNSGIVFEGHLSNASLLQGKAWLTGGTVGPEGSIFSFLTMGILAIAIHFLFPAKKSEPAQIQENQAN
jgi:membrane protease YdiL (CAAX protease family)